MADDTALDEKRVYGERGDRTVAFVAAAPGVTRVELSGDQVGRFSLLSRTTATDVAGGSGALVVATDEDVLLGTGEELAPTGFGRATAVAIADGMPVAAGPGGRVALLRDDEWVPAGSVTDPRCADGDLLAADSVSRVGETVTALGSPPGEVRDLAAAGPYAATDAGLYRHDGRGWEPLVDDDCRLVAAAGERACVVTGSAVLVRQAGGWQPVESPGSDSLAGLAYGEGLYAVTASGTVLVRAAAEETPGGHSGWRSRALGVREVVGVAVP